MIMALDDFIFEPTIAPYQRLKLNIAQRWAVIGAEPVYQHLGPGKNPGAINRGTYTPGKRV